MNADGSNRRILVEAQLSQYVTRVTWAPNGEWIAYDSSVGSGEAFQYRIMAIPSGGGSSVTLSSGAGDELAPSWSPDGTRIAFIRWLGVSAGPISAHLQVMRATARTCGGSSICTTSQPRSLPGRRTGARSPTWTVRG